MIMFDSETEREREREKEKKTSYQVESNVIWDSGVGEDDVSIDISVPVDGIQNTMLNFISVSYMSWMR